MRKSYEGKYGMKRKAAWLLLVWFVVALTGCESIKGLGRDIGNLGDVLGGKSPSHKSFQNEKQKQANSVAFEQNRVAGHLEMTR